MGFDRARRPVGERMNALACRFERSLLIRPMQSNAASAQEILDRRWPRAIDTTNLEIPATSRTPRMAVSFGTCRNESGSSGASSAKPIGRRMQRRPLHAGRPPRRRSLPAARSAIRTLIPYQRHPSKQLVRMESSVFGGGRGAIRQGERRQARNALDARGVVCKRVPRTVTWRLWGVAGRVCYPTARV